ncbi:EAL domain-containing protein, partial [Streptomyces flaveolus]|uniref:EAL domain-containing protein n=2 Tax=Streptomyces flaveolus TaxID=67297 RepID=UPI00331A30F1
ESARLHKITSGLLRIATDLGLASVADGVDLPEQIVALRAMGCTHGQGMAFSGPLDEHRLRRALGTGHYPVPHGPAEPVFAGGGAGVYTNTVGAGVGNAPTGPVAGGVGSGMPAVLGGGTALRSHNETPVPPT